MRNCNTQEASLRVDDLFELLNIKNQKALYNELINLITKYSMDIVKSSWVDIMHECVPPNDQLSGRIPKLGRIREIFDKKRTVVNNEWQPVDALPQKSKDQFHTFLKMCQNDIKSMREKKLTKEKMFENHAAYLKSVGANHDFTRKAR